MKKMKIGSSISCATFLIIVFSSAFFSGSANAAVYSFLDDFSGSSNPNGVWSYGRKWTVTGSDFDLLTVFGDPPDPGWWFGNWGHGAPNIRTWGGMWAKDNSNGYPVVRWTNPAEGFYDLASIFTGADSRGVKTTGYVTLNGSIQFSDTIDFYQDTAEFSFSNVRLEAGDYIDFVVVFNGGISAETSWTALNATISSVPIPPTLYLFGSGLLGLVGIARRKNEA